MNEELKQVETVLDEKVRPALRSHGGAIEVDRLENGVLYVKLLGHCAGCPSADLTTETLVEAELVKALPELVEKVCVVQDVSDELWNRRKSSCGTTTRKGGTFEKLNKTLSRGARDSFVAFTSCGSSRPEGVMAK